MEEKTHFIEPLLERVQEYSETSYQLFKFKTVDKIATSVSAFVSHSIVVFFLLLFVMIASVGAAFLIGDLLGKIYYGFFCVAGFYGIIGVVIYLFMYNTIKKRVGDSIILQLLN